MRHAVAFLLTLLTSILAGAIAFVTAVVGCFLWPVIILLCLGMGYLCRRSPLAPIFYGLPLSGGPSILVAVVCLSRGWRPAGVSFDGVLLVLLSGLSVVAVYMGFLRSIQAITGGVIGEHDVKAMEADERGE